MFLWRAFHTTMVSRLEDTRRFNGRLVRTMRGTSQRRCPLRLRLFWMSATSRYLLETGERCHQSRPTQDSPGKRSFGIWNLGHVLSPGQSDSRSDWRSIQVRALAGTRPCHHDRGDSTMGWIGAFHDRTNWCCLVVARKQGD